MPLKIIKKEWSALSGRQRGFVIAVLSLLILCTTCKTASGQPAATAVDSVTVPVSLLQEATLTIDDLEFQLAVRDSQLVAQQDYYLELLGLKDKRISILEDTVKDALGSPAKDFFEKLVWGAAGYGLRAAVE